MPPPCYPASEPGRARLSQGRLGLGFVFPWVIYKLCSGARCSNPAFYTHRVMSFGHRTASAAKIIWTSKCFSYWFLWLLKYCEEVEWWVTPDNIEDRGQALVQAFQQASANGFRKVMSVKHSHRLPPVRQTETNTAGLRGTLKQSDKATKTEFTIFMGSGFVVLKY